MWKLLIKRILKYVGIVFLAIILLAGSWCFFGGACCNDIRAVRLERAYASMELPEGVSRIETTSFVGNTTGTGNHTEIWAGMLLYTELPEIEKADTEAEKETGISSEATYFQKFLEEYFKGHEIYAVPEDLTSYYPYEKDFIEFQALQGKDSGKGYFVVGNYYDAFTQVDLRGH